MKENDLKIGATLNLEFIQTLQSLFLSDDVGIFLRDLQLLWEY